MESSFRIRIASTGDVFEVPSNKTMLHVLFENGYRVQIDCSNGRCGTCKTRYLEGSPDHRDAVLEPTERGEFLTVCVSRALSSEIVLDLPPPVPVTSSEPPPLRPTASVEAPVCVACLNCVRFCTFGAARIDDTLIGVGGIVGAAIIDETICTGCGVCAAACPTGAIEMNLKPHGELLETIQELNDFDPIESNADATLSKSDRSNVLLFSCPQCKSTTNTAIENPNPKWQQSLNAQIVNVPCSGRIDTLQLIHAFETGADGVLVLGCEPGSCYFNTGNLHAEQRVRRVRSWLKECGMKEERIQMVHIAGKHSEKLDEVLYEFGKEMKSIGQNLLSKKTIPPTTYNVDVPRRTH